MNYGLRPQKIITMAEDDIRRGNQVLLKASGTTATVIKVDNDTVILETFPTNSSCARTEISGIELTTSMLRKLSFTNEEEPNKWSGHGLSIRTNPDGFFYGLRIAKNRARIQHLHDVQNYVEDFYLLFREINYSLDIDILEEN